MDKRQSLHVKVTAKRGVDTRSGPGRHSPACPCPACLGEPVTVTVVGTKRQIERLRKELAR